MDGLDKNSEYDINKAKQLLTENGWAYRNNEWRKNGKKLEFNLVVNKDKEERIQCANKIKEQLNEIGIIINIVEVNNNRYNNYLKNKNYDMIMCGSIVSNNPNLETYFGEGNLSNYYNQEVENILNELKNISDEQTLIDRYSELANIYNNEMPFISLYFNNIFILSNKELKGDLSHNWYNLFYNIDNWYKVGEN